jgi:hypothetical protein
MNDKTSWRYQIGKAISEQKGSLIKEVELGDSRLIGKPSLVFVTIITVEKKLIGNRCMVGSSIS